MLERVKCLKCGMVDKQNIYGLYQRQIIKMRWNNMAPCGGHAAMNVGHRG